MAYANNKGAVCLSWGLTSQSTIFQSCRDGATASWVITSTFGGVKCLAQGHNTAVVGFEPPTSRSGVRHSTTEPPRSPNKGADQPLKRRNNGNGVAESELEQADEFNCQFTDVFNKNEHSQVPLPNQSAHFMNDIVVSAVGVTKLLKGLNPSKALGPDELHPRGLKELASELGLVFAHLFQQSIDMGEIPKEWSLANKKGDRSLACNYRPVSLTYVPCMLLEHIVCSNIMAHLDEHKLLSDRQHAFRKRHSCETQLITVINDWAKLLDDDGQVDISWTSRKLLIHPLMNYLNASCMVMVLVERLWNE